MTILNRSLALLPGETVLWHGPAMKLPEVGLSIGGTLYMTNERLAFVPNRLRSAKRFWSSPSSEIMSTGVEGPLGVPYKSMIHSIVVVHLFRDEAVRFRTSDSEKTAPLLNSLLRNGDVGGDAP
jgi:hypothetical protein